MTEEATETAVDINAESARIIYEASVKAYDSLVPLLDRYRSDAVRTLTVVTAVGAFLTFDAAANRLAFTVAAIFYILAVAVTAAIYKPVALRTNIAKGAPQTLRDHPEESTPQKVYCELAIAYQAAHDENHSAISGRFGTANRYSLLLILSLLTVLAMLWGAFTETSNEPDQTIRVLLIEE